MDGVWKEKVWGRVYEGPYGIGQECLLGRQDRSKFGCDWLDFLAHGGLVVKPYRQGRGFDPIVRSSRVLPVPRFPPSVQRHAR